MIELVIGVMIGVAGGAIAVFIILTVSVGPSNIISNTSGDTIVDLRDTKGVVKYHYHKKVKYDAWGSPYVVINSACQPILLPQGKTDCWYRGTIWKRVAGPPVKFAHNRDSDIESFIRSAGNTIDADGDYKRQDD